MADLIHAETEMQRKQALLQANGSLALLYSRWRQELLRSCAHFEAFIDFGEDENIEHDVLAQVSSNVAKVVDEMRRHLSKECGERLRTGVRTVILGEPNAGKSSFLNLLSQRSVAIISDIPGTTRDVIETSLNIGGYPVVLMDTAGLRQSTQDQVEQEGIRRARKVAENADLIIVIVNGDAVLAHWHRISELGRRTATMMTHFMDVYVRRLGIDGLDAKPKVIAINKVDLFDGDLIKSVQNCNRTGDLVVGGGGSGDGVALLSCTTSFGLSDVISQIEAQLDSMYVHYPICIYNLLLISIRMVEIVSVRSESSANVCASLSIYLSTYIPFFRCTYRYSCGGQPTAESPHLSQSRYRFLLTECLEHLEKFLINLNRINGDDDNDTFIDLAITASHLQAAVRCLGKISGHVSVDDILDVIFKEFCIGK